MDLIGKNLLLDLPASLILLKSLLILGFLIHILFINFMIGSSFFSVLFDIINRRKHNPIYLQLSEELITTVTVNKSIGVVLGVAPLLIISLVYTKFFYTANILTAPLWLSVIWLVALSFLLLYIYKFTFSMRGSYYKTHIFCGIVGTSILFIIPFIFLSNINLMLYPSKWHLIDNPFKAVLLTNVIPRYLHFITASFALTGFFIYFYLYKVKNRSNTDDEYKQFTKKFSLKLALHTTLLQPVFGLLLLFTLPEIAVSLTTFILAGVGLIITLIICLLIYIMMTQTDKKYNISIMILLIFLLIIMVMNRHLIRKNALNIPISILEANTSNFKTEINKFITSRKPVKTGISTTEKTEEKGENVFNDICIACHSFEERLVGPPFNTVIPKYKDDPKKLETYIAKPVRVDPDYPEMPELDLPKYEISAVAHYLIEKTK